MRNDLKLPKGRTFEAIISVDNFGEPYTLKDSEKLVFGVKLNTEDTDYILKKELTSEDKVDGGYALVLTAEEMALLPLYYKYDIALITSDGGAYTVVGCSNFEVTKTVVNYNG